MNKISTLEDFKARVQAGFENNEESLELFGKSYSTQLKAYLVESNQTLDSINCPDGKWKLLDSTGWYCNEGGSNPESFFLDATRNRVWIAYSILDAAESDLLVSKWVDNLKGLDRCWLSRKQLLHWENSENWSQRGLGLRFSDSLSPEENAVNFSLKAWYGANRYIEGLDDVINKAKDKFAIYSVRWQKSSKGSISLSAELYSNGKITLNRGNDVDEALLSVSEIANRYDDALMKATALRDNTMGAFELNFSQEIDLDIFSKTVCKGTGAMKLWLVETENEVDFRRFRGVDLHTWDRVLLDVGPNFAYLSIPGKGCVNAAPRIATIQGEENAGKTSILHDGVEIFV